MLSSSVSCSDSTHSCLPSLLVELSLTIVMFPSIDVRVLQASPCVTWEVWTWFWQTSSTHFHNLLKITGAWELYLARKVSGQLSSTLNASSGGRRLREARGPSRCGAAGHSSGWDFLARRILCHMPMRSCGFLRNEWARLCILHPCVPGICWSVHVAQLFFSLSGQDFQSSGLVHGSRACEAGRRAGKPHRVCSAGARPPAAHAISRSSTGSRTQGCEE